MHTPTTASGDKLHASFNDHAPHFPNPNVSNSLVVNSVSNSLKTMTEAWGNNAHTLFLRNIEPLYPLVRTQCPFGPQTPRDLIFPCHFIENPLQRTSQLRKCGHLERSNYVNFTLELFILQLYLLNSLVKKREQQLCYRHRNPKHTKTVAQPFSGFRASAQISVRPRSFPCTRTITPLGRLCV